MSVNLKRLERINEGEGKKESKKGNEASKNDLLEKTQRICMPSNKKKMDIPIYYHSICLVIKRNYWPIT